MPFEVCDELGTDIDDCLTASGSRFGLSTGASGGSWVCDTATISIGSDVTGAGCVVTADGVDVGIMAGSGEWAATATGVGPLVTGAGTGM